MKTSGQDFTLWRPKRNDSETSETRTVTRQVICESRDGVQAQGKEIKDQINEKMEEQKSIREIAKQHRDRRDEIQNRIRELIGKSRGKKEDDRNSRSSVIQLAETESEISYIEDRIMTDGKIKFRQREQTPETTQASEG